MSLWSSHTHSRILVLLSAIAIAGLATLSPSHSAERADPSFTQEKADGEVNSDRGRTAMILGVSWQPGYCASRPRSTECRSLDAGAAASRQFSLHGLWTVKKRYCGVDERLKAQDKSRKWLELPELALEEKVRLDLSQAMPGVASGLDRHEWLMHGTCSGQLASAYYRRSLGLLDALNQSPVKDLFFSRIGQTLGEREIKAAFNSAFGEGAGDKVKMRCAKSGDRNVITGLTIGLGVGEEDDSLDVLIGKAGRTKFGCAEGLVGAAGAI